MRHRTKTGESADTSAAVTTSGGVSTNLSTTTAASATKNASKTDENVNYLRSYEGMVRHQDLEFDATYGHMQSIFERIQTLGSRKNADGEVDRKAEAEYPSGMLTYLQIRRCLLRLGVGWNHCCLPSVDADYDDDVSVLSFNSVSSAGNSALGSINGRSDIIATDAQLIMLLTAMVEMEEKSRASNAKYQVLDHGLFLPEFIQAYKLIIGGMQSLKSIPTINFKFDNPAELELCNRLKERTMGMLRPFGPDSKLYNDENRRNSVKSNKDALSTEKGSLRNVQGKKSPGRKKKAKMSKFSKDDMTKLLSQKDNALTKIMEDHELEMGALVSSMEKLRLEGEVTRSALMKRRKRLRTVAVILGGILVLVGIVVESGRRAFLVNEIALGREAEQLATSQTIARSKEKKSELEKKLSLLEGKMRYQVNKIDGVEAQTREIEKRIDDVDMKWLMDKAEIEQCVSSQVESSEGLKREQSKKEEVDEELVWCRSRYNSRERELNEFEHISVGGDAINKKGLIARISDDGSDNATKNEKPVYLEMKYNRSTRNAMFLRQTYSAIAGVAVSMLLQGLVPTAIKLFASKAAVVVPPPPVLLTRRVEMKLVDGIFGSSVAFLLVQALLTFVKPL
mmetsp:Transcript_17932/g.43116  ORF Transcript_17932/g.43116 Transcript_17932/m.43116 type:complete len:623 (-) Transcript_17932:31-1899(-)